MSLGHDTDPCPPPAVVLSRDAETLLLAICDESGVDEEPLDAKVWANEMVELFAAGLARIAGTLSAASILSTAEGRRVAAQLRAGT